MAACTFFGHRNIVGKIDDKVYNIIEVLINDYGVNTFYVGNNGTFDKIVRRVLQRIKRTYCDVRYYVVIAYLPQNNDEDYSDSIYPDGIERIPPRFAILWRNEWMLNRSDYVIGYINHFFGGAYKFFEKAKRKKKTVWNIADFE